MKVLKKISAAIISVALAAGAVSCTDNDKYEEHQWETAATTLPGTWNVIETKDLSTMANNLNEEYFEENEVSAILYPEALELNADGNGVYKFRYEEKQQYTTEDGTAATKIVQVPGSTTFTYSYNSEDETIELNFPATNFYEAVTISGRAVISRTYLYLYMQFPAPADVLKKA